MRRNLFCIYSIIIQERGFQMKKIVTCFMLVLLTVCFLTACQCKHEIQVPASCTSGQICSTCGEILSEPYGHSWTPATCTQPSSCTVCHITNGTPAEHIWMETVNQSGIGGKLCMACGEYQMDSCDWIPLTACEKIAVSNKDAHELDLVVGKWKTNSGVFPDSIRFCVSNKEDYKNTHYCVYRLRGNYQSLSGLVSFSQKSEKFATARVLIYLDNELAFESHVLSDSSTDESFALDVSDVDLVRVVCSTTDMPSAYCVVSASVY